MEYDNFKSNPDEEEDPINFLNDDVDNADLPIDIYTPKEPSTVNERLQFLDAVVNKIFETIESSQTKQKIYFDNIQGIYLFCKLYHQKGYRFKKRYARNTKMHQPQTKWHIISSDVKFVNSQRRPYIEIIKE